MQTALPVSPEAAAALLAISDADGLAMDVSVNGIQAASGASMGVRGGVRGGVRAIRVRIQAPGGSEDCRGASLDAPSGSGGSKDPPLLRTSPEEEAEVSFQLESDNPVTIPGDVLAAAQEAPPVQPAPDLFTVVRPPLVQLSVRPNSSPEMPLIESKASLDPRTASTGGTATVEPDPKDVVLVDSDGNGVSSLIETAVLVTEGVPLSDAIKIANDPISELKPTAEEVKAAFTVMAAKLEAKAAADLKGQGLDVAAPKIDVETLDVTPPDTSVTSSTGADGAVMAAGETMTFTFACTKQECTYECKLDGPSPPSSPPLADSPSSPVRHGGRTRGEGVVAAPFMGASSDAGVKPAPTSSVIARSPRRSNLSGETPGLLRSARNDNPFSPCANPFVVTTPDMSALGSGMAAFTLRVTAVDSLGGRDTTPASYTWMVDTTPPDTSLVSSEQSAVSSKTSNTFTFTSNETDSTFQCSLDAAAYSSCSSPLTVSLLTDGSHLFSVRAVDKVNNKDPSPATFSWMVDTTAPTVTISSQPSAISNQLSATFEFVGTDSNPSASVSFQCKLDQPGAAGSLATCTSPLTLSASGGLSKGDGSYTFTVQATDTAGNTATTTYTWTLDTTGPSAAISSQSSSGGSAVSGSTSATFAFSSTEISATFECDMDSGGYSTCTSPKVYTGLAGGSHTFRVRAKDSVGNAGTAATSTWTIDLTAPTFSGLTSATGTSKTQINLAWSAASDAVSAASAIVYYICQSTTTGSCATSFSDTYTTSAGATSYSVTGLSADTRYFFVARAADGVSNRDTNTTEVNARTRGYVSRLASSSNGNGMCAVRDDNTARCWGVNTTGELGQGSTATLGDGAGEMGTNLPAISLGSGRTATALAGGNGHTCAILDNGTAKCWGANGAGELGQGSTATLGDGAGEMGDNLAAISLGTSRTASALAAGNNHSCALLDNSTVKCWGDAAFGQIGQGNTSDLGDAGGEMGDSLTAIDLGTGRTALAVTAGGDFTCARLDNSTVKCWGFGGQGQLGSGASANLGDGGGEMGDNLFVVSLTP